MMVKFKTTEAMERFLTLLSRERDDLAHAARAGQVRPDVVLQGLSPEDEQWVNEHLDGDAKAFAEVQFETMDLP